jgi:hypothetical protein
MSTQIVWLLEYRKHHQNNWTPDFTFFPMMDEGRARQLAEASTGRLFQYRAVAYSPVTPSSDLMAEYRDDEL